MMHIASSPGEKSSAVGGSLGCCAGADCVHDFLHQLPPIVSASAKVQGPHIPVTLTTGFWPQLSQPRVQSRAKASAVASSDLSAGILLTFQRRSALLRMSLRSLTCRSPVHYPSVKGPCSLLGV